MVGALIVFQVDELLYEGFFSVDGWGDFEEAALHQDSQVGNEIAAGDEVTTVRIQVRVPRAGDGDRYQAGSQA